MDTIGLDLHKRESQLCTLTDAGEIVEQRIATTRDRFTAVLGNVPRRGCRWRPRRIIGELQSPPNPPARSVTYPPGQLRYLSARLLSCGRGVRARAVGALHWFAPS